MLVLVYLDHFPSEEDLNTSFLALIKHVLAEEMLVVESLEVRAFAFIGELRGIADKITVSVVPAVIVVDISALLDIYCVNEHVALGFVLEVRQALNEVDLVVETSG